MATFDKEFKALLNQCKETAEQYRLVTGSEKSKCVPLDCLNRYAHIYHNKTQPEEHYIYIKKFYSKNREAILGFQKDLHWPMCSGEIRFGKGVVDDERTKRITIMIASIYKMADELKGKKSEHTITKDSIRCEIINYHLTRLCHIVAKQEFPADIDKLQSLIDILEKELGIAREIVHVETGGGNSGGGLKAIMDMAVGILDAAGVPTDSVSKASEGDLQAMIKGVCENPAVKSIVANVANAVKDNKDPTAILTQLISTSLNPENIANIAKIEK